MSQYLTAQYILPCLLLMVLFLGIGILISIFSACRKALSPAQYRAANTMRHAVRLVPTRKLSERLEAVCQKQTKWMSGQIEAEVGSEDRRHVIHYVMGSVFFLFLFCLLMACETPLIEQVVQSIFHISASGQGIGSTSEFLRNNAWGLIAAVIIWPVFLLEMMGLTNMAPWMKRGGKKLKITMLIFSLMFCCIAFAGLGIMFFIQNEESYGLNYAGSDNVTMDMSSLEGQNIDLESQLSMLDKDVSYKPSKYLYQVGQQCTKAAIHGALAFSFAGLMTSFRWLLLGLTTVFVWLPCATVRSVCNRRVDVLAQKMDYSDAKLTRQIANGRRFLSIIGITAEAEEPLRAVNTTVQEQQSDEIPSQPNRTPEDDRQEHQNVSEKNQQVNDRKNENDQVLQFDNQPSASGFDPFGAIAGGR